MSIRYKLIKELETSPQLTLNDLAYLCKMWGYKMVTADRVLRDMRSMTSKNYDPRLMVTMNGLGNAIINYYFEHETTE